MAGRDRVQVSLELAQRLVAAQFPQFADLGITPIQPGGWDNCSFRLGHDYTLRMPTASRYAVQVAKEQCWLPRLAPHLPLPIPEPVAMGKPGEGYPHPWSILRWIEAQEALHADIAGDTTLARDLAGFLSALHRAPADDGPPAGDHNFHRGGVLAVYDSETQTVLNCLQDDKQRANAEAVWARALASHWPHAPVWVHGDIAPDNLLMHEGRLSAVLDFGQCGVGDPACDLAIAWTGFDGPARAVFLDVVGLDRNTLNRARGWGLWKALISLNNPDAQVVARAQVALAELLKDA